MTASDTEGADPMSAKVAEPHYCNKKGPGGYLCKIALVVPEDAAAIPHSGMHIASAINGAALGSEIVRWTALNRPHWNLAYHGR